MLLYLKHLPGILLLVPQIFNKKLPRNYSPLFHEFFTAS